MPRTISELLGLNLDRLAIPVDERGNQIFSEENPGYMADLVARAALASLATEAAEILEEVIELEDHFHNDELWWGALAAPTESAAIDMNVNRPFAAASGNNTWGVVVPVIGSNDNPAKIWQTRYDLHRVLITEPTNATPWRLRFLYGDQSYEEAAQASRWTEIMFIATGVGANVDTGPIEVRFPQIDVGWRVWAQCWNATNLAALEFFIGVHGYPVMSLHH